MRYANRINFKIKKPLVCLLSLLMFTFCTFAMNQTYAEASGKIVVANDYFPLSFPLSANASNFVINVANWFMEGDSGRFLVDNTFMSLTWEDPLQTNGLSWEWLPVFPDTLSKLQKYDGIFIACEAVDNDLLTEYVNLGGNIYLSGGTDCQLLSGAGSEAAVWNSFLNDFGLQFLPSLESYQYNTIDGDVDIDSIHPIFQDVSGLYQTFGNDIVDLDPSDDRGKVLVSYYDGQGTELGLYAVFDGSQVGSDNSGPIDQEESQVDSDNDGITDDWDACPSTSTGEIVDIDGCSLNDLCPCEYQWKNHGAYVTCVAQESELLVSEGLISEDEKDELVSSAAQSRCGHKK